MRIQGPATLRGVLQVPGDKSISHRVAMLASIARGASRITGFASSADCHSTLDCVRRLGIRVDLDGDGLVIHGNGLRGYDPGRRPVHLDAGNSGSTIRMLSGLLAAQRFTSVIDGDESLRKRPMGRIIEPLALMGAGIEAKDGNLAPLTIHGAPLKSIDYVSRVASAQVKTCVLYGGLYAEGRTTFKEPSRSRDHTELMLKEFGAKLYELETGPSPALAIEGGLELRPIDYTVPGDLSSAAFILAAATILKDSEVLVRNACLNPSRTAFVDVLNMLGAQIETENTSVRHSEAVGDLRVRSSALKSEPGGTLLRGDLIPNLIDEIPVLAVVATQVEGRVEVRDARELRIKESDRLTTVAHSIRAMGGEIEEFEDGFAISGPQRLKGGRIETAGDHRIAMAFSVAAMAADGITEIAGAECASVSFPEFYQALASLAGDGVIL